MPDGTLKWIDFRIIGLNFQICPANYEADVQTLLKSIGFPKRTPTHERELQEAISKYCRSPSKEGIESVYDKAK
jgi:hypothetical protein